MPDAGEAWLEDLLACVHCGFCLPACPTYDVRADENDSPRGRIHLMRALAEGRLETGGAFDLHIGRCLGCRACETACPAGVPYGSLLERARTRTAPGGAKGAGLDLMLALLTRGRLARLVYAAGRLLRGSRIADVGARVLPGRAGLAAGMLAATRPARALPGAARPGERSPAPADRPGGTFALLEGCVMRGLYGHVHAASRRSLRRRGLAERAARGQACCGALHAHAGRLEAARALARRNIEAFERSGADVVVADAAGCGAALRDYPHWLRDDPAWSGRAGALATRVRDVSELLASVEPGATRVATDRAGTSEAPSRGGAAGPAVRVAYDAPCHLLHAQGIRHAPLEALAGAGVRVEPLPSWERCCGGAGLYNLLEPELSAEVARPKLEEIAAGRFDLLATGNPGCAMFLGACLRRAGLETAPVHPVELVDAAERDADTERERTTGWS